jgi:hypothetical protein
MVTLNFRRGRSGMEERKKILLFIIIILILAPPLGLFGQETPSYSFISFTSNYNRLINAARADGYQVIEEEIAAVHGNYHILLQKPGQFYGENISLFFNENRELIFFSIRFELNQNHSQRIIEKLIVSMGEKLEDKYGENEREHVPYFRIYENNFEIYLYPQGPAPTNARLSIKQLNRYDLYQEFYREEVERLENEEIAETLENL